MPGPSLGRVYLKCTLSCLERASPAQGRTWTVSRVQGQPWISRVKPEKESGLEWSFPEREEGARVPGVLRMERWLCVLVARECLHEREGRGQGGVS